MSNRTILNLKNSIQLVLSYNTLEFIKKGGQSIFFFEYFEDCEEVAGVDGQATIKDLTYIKDYILKNGSERLIRAFNRTIKGAVK